MSKSGVGVFQLGVTNDWDFKKSNTQPVAREGGNCTKKTLRVWHLGVLVTSDKHKQNTAQNTPESKTCPSLQKNGALVRTGGILYWLQT